MRKLKSRKCVSKIVNRLKEMWYTDEYDYDICIFYMLCGQLKHYSSI